MKKYIVYILLTCLLLSCFAGCKQTKTAPEEVTQTDVTQTQVEAQEDSVIAEELQQTEEEKEKTQATSPANKAVTKQHSNTTTSKKQAVTAKKDSNTQSKTEANQSTTSKVDPIKIHGDIAQNNPTFVSEEALQIWLQQGSGAYETQRTEYLALTKKNNAINYFWPSDELTKLIPFKKLEIHSTNHKYSFFYQESLVVAANIDKSTSTYKSFEELYNSCKARYDEGHKNYGLIKDKNSAIEFYYYISDLNCTFIYWEQYGFVHTAQLFDQSVPLEKLISLLKLDQVTINLNSDQVTQ